MPELDEQLTSTRRSFRVKLILGSLASMVIGAVAIGLLFFTHSIAYRVTPPPASAASVTVTDGIGVVRADTVYLFGAHARLSVTAPGFISREVTVDANKISPPLVIEMMETPARVTVTTSPESPDTRWYVDEVYIATAAQFESEFSPGLINIGIENAFYRDATVQLTAERGAQLTHNVNLVHITGEINVDTEPHAATVTVNEIAKGVTPLALTPLPGGEHHLRIMLRGYETITETVTLTNAEPTVTRDYRLKRKQAAARIKVSPAGGTLRVNGVAVQMASEFPELPLTAGIVHIIRYDKAGYVGQSREVKLKVNARANLKFSLKEEVGEVTVRSTPSSAVFVNGKRAGETPLTLNLRAVQQKIQLVRDGYRTVMMTVTPSAASSLLVDETLRTEFAARLAEATPTVIAGDVTLKLFDPRAHGEFTMGASTDDKARRANEFQREVRLTKPFYVGVTEITEAQFAKYQPSSPASAKPVRNISWYEAAEFCNWMSARDGLQAVYALENAGAVRANANADGYRLLTEAEWEWLARVVARPARARFVWGDDTTIPTGSGNFADESAVGAVPKYIAHYKDGFADVAPVASFVADVAGLYDMAGNVGEWAHDRYDLRPPRAGAGARENPFGAHGGDGVSGDARVVKGASFRTASITGLRASFREGLSRGRDDLGFRVARYLYGAE